MSMPAPPPDTRAAGQPGHIADHNEISDALAWLGSAVAALQAQSSTARALIPQAVQAASFAVTPNGYYPCDISAGSFTATLPAAPADGTLAGFKVVGAAPALQYALTVAASGLDRINRASGGVSASLLLMSQGTLLQYSATFGLWYVTSDDVPLSSMEQLLGGWMPSDQGYIAWNGDPNLYQGTQATASGTHYLIRVPVRSAQVISAVHVLLATPGSGMTSAAMGLVGPTGTLLSQGSALSVLQGAAGDAPVTLAAPQAVTAGTYWADILCVGGTQPVLVRASPVAYGAGLAPAAYRYAVNGTSLSALPGSIAPSANVPGVSFWAAVS